MKRTAYLCALVLFVVVNPVSAQTKPSKMATSHKGLVNPAAAKKKKKGGTILEGKALVAKGDCLSCHRVDIKLIGPAYSDVAKHYALTPENYTLLTKKIISGGSGTWGEVPMSPHPELSAIDAKKMVVYILSLK